MGKKKYYLVEALLVIVALGVMVWAVALAPSNAVPYVVAAFIAGGLFGVVGVLLQDFKPDYIRGQGESESLESKEKKIVGW